ncbi:E3 ubiquitin-protein ligase TRIM39-like [Megalops cyprinoides]|uniref:E3 ubiquitin-protein ligase TRIM39-like n=1 Tax=Megalops cyprinoides TaxID=118141 RepID=UPI0018652335|nr:E3 ubiquitin-protein ligase TRIM39-like [Megalops cyprinoides]
MKSILKEKNMKHQFARVNIETAAQSHSVGAVRWTLQEEDLQGHSSAPSQIGSSTTKSKDLKDMRTLQECVRFIHQWKEEVDRVCKHGSDARAGSKKAQKSDPRTERSKEECHRLILQWAEELNSVDVLFNQSPWRHEKDAEEEQENKDKDTDPNELVKQRNMEWAKELQSMSENCGVPREDLTQMLRQLEVRKRGLVSLLPFLEFITWSLLKEGSKGVVPQLWLLAKQRSWKVGMQKYIPNSVWSWICSASADVTLDPMTNHPWLLLSDDRKKVQESLSEMEVTQSKQRFDGWPCVLGWEGFSSGRHYWEVNLANNGYWRLGVTTASSRRHGRFPMTPSEGYWTLWRSTRQFYACTKPETQLPVHQVPRKVGVYLDYEEGQISFYNVETKTHIYTYSDTFRDKLYPLFAPLDGRTLITVSSPNSDPEF